MAAIRFFLIFFSLLRLAHAQTFVLTNNPINITTGFRYLQDTSKSMTFTQAVQALSKSTVKYSSKDVPVEGYEVYWIYFTMQNKSGFDREWLLNFENWSYADLYENKSSSYSIHQTGHLLDFQKRSYRVANKSYILLPIKDNETIDCYVRLESRFNNELIPKTICFSAIPRETADRENTRVSIAIYSFLAIMAAMFLYNFFIFLSTGLINYLYYLIVIFFSIYHTAYNSGYIIEIFGAVSSFPLILTQFERFSSLFYGLAILTFAAKFLSVQERYPAWHLVIQVINGLYYLSAIFMLVHEIAGLFFSALSAMATIFTIIILAIKSTRDHYPASVYFLIGYSCFLFFSIVLILSLIGIIPKNVWTTTFSLPIGSTIEIIFFSFALGNLINELKRKNDESQKKYNQSIQEKKNLESAFDRELLKTKIEIQEQTFQQISQEIHDNIQQKLTLAKIHINSLNFSNPDIVKEKMLTSKSLLSDAIQDLRDLAKALNTDYIHTIGLIRAVEQQLLLLKKTGLFTTEFSVKGEPFFLDRRRELMAFRIVQELLNNILKHAQATVVSISLEFESDRLNIKVKDNGKGIDEAALEFMAKQSLGWQNIRQRASLIKGSIYYNTHPDKGTEVILELIEHQQTAETLPQV